MAETYPYSPGTTIRTGKPCSSGSGSPFMPIARIALRSSCSTESGVPAVNPSMLRESTMSAPAVGIARFNSSRIGYPSHRALPIRSPPTSFDTHVRVVTLSSSGRPISSSQVSSTSFSTSPVMRSDQVPGSMRGIWSAVSMR